MSKNMSTSSVLTEARVHLLFVFGPLVSGQRSSVLLKYRMRCLVALTITVIIRFLLLFIIICLHHQSGNFFNFRLHLI